MQSRRDFLRISGVAATIASGASHGGEEDDEIDWNLGFFQPTRLETALAIRGRLGGEVVPVAGATLVGRLLQSGELGGRRLLDLSRIDGFSSLTKQEDTYLIFPGASFRTLEEEAPLGALATAARGVGGPAIRNRATLGGNLIAASPEGDGCVATLAIPSRVELRSLTHGARMVSIDDFFGPEEGKTALRPDELLTKILVPKGWRSVWSEVGIRTGASHSLVCSAIGQAPTGEVRIALGGAGPSVRRAKGAEAEIARGELGDAAIKRATDALAAEIHPVDDWRASADYRRAMCAVMVRRLLISLRAKTA